MLKHNSNAFERAMFNEAKSPPEFAAMVIAPCGDVSFFPITCEEDCSFASFKAQMGLPESSLLERIEAALFTMIADTSILCFVDEEGLLNDSLPNKCASVFAGQPIVGPALFINRQAFYYFKVERDMAFDEANNIEPTEFEDGLVDLAGCDDMPDDSEIDDREEFQNMLREHGGSH